MNKTLLIVFVLVVAGGLACTSQQGDTSNNAAQAAECDSTLVERSYTGLRGVIEKDTAGQFYIRHGAVPEFMGPCGEAPLDAGGILPFVLGKDADTTGLSEQDSVTFDLLVNWDTIPLPGIITSIEKDGG